MLVFARDGAREEMLGRGEMPPIAGSGRGEKILTNNALQIGLNCEHILYTKITNLELRVVKMLTVRRNLRKFKC